MRPWWRQALTAAAALTAGAGPAGAALHQHRSPAEGEVITASGGARTLMVSFDGFRHDYLDLLPREALPNLNRLRDSGVQVQGGLKNVFITKTFPNHWTLATGLYEESHGVVGNSFWDPNICDIGHTGPPHLGVSHGGCPFTMDTTDPRWWGGEPIWHTMENAGRKTGTFFWPGSDVPAFQASLAVVPYNGSIPFEARVDQVLKWLSVEDGDAAEFVALYFDEPDHTGHLYGPDSEEMKTTLRRVDAIVGSLMLGVASPAVVGPFDDLRGKLPPVNLIVTSDHGMAQTAADRTVYLDECLEPLKEKKGLYEAFEVSPVAMLWVPCAPSSKCSRSDAPGGGTGSALRDEMYSLLAACSPNLKVWKKEDVPDRFHWSHSNRVSDLVLLVDEGWSICRAREGHCFNCCGNHGYDNANGNMHQLMLAAGPAFRTPGGQIAQIESVDVYPMLCHIHGIDRPAPNNGSAERWCPLLSDAERAKGACASSSWSPGGGGGGSGSGGGGTPPASTSLKWIYICVGVVIGVCLSGFAVGAAAVCRFRRSQRSTDGEEFLPLVAVGGDQRADTLLPERGVGAEPPDDGVEEEEGDQG